MEAIKIIIKEVEIVFTQEAGQTGQVKEVKTLLEQIHKLLEKNCSGQNSFDNKMEQVHSSLNDIDSRLDELSIERLQEPNFSAELKLLHTELTKLYNLLINIAEQLKTDTSFNSENKTLIPSSTPIAKSAVVKPDPIKTQLSQNNKAIEKTLPTLSAPPDFIKQAYDNFVDKQHRDDFYCSWFYADSITDVEDSETIGNTTKCFTRKENPQSCFLIFQEKGKSNDGWLYINRRLGFSEIMGQVFPDLSRETFENKKKSLKPIPVRYDKTKEYWKTINE